MNKLVYLFELDSVRSYEEEVRQAQHSLFHEIVKNGNQIVLTYNQIIDSHGFLVMLLEEETFQELLSLIEKGFIKFSQYGSGSNLVRSPIQYTLSALKKPSFLFTALPMSAHDHELKDLLAQGIQNVDVTIFENVDWIDEKEKLFLQNFVRMITLLSLEDSAINKPKPSTLPTITLFEFFQAFATMQQCSPNTALSAYDLNQILPEAVNFIQTHQQAVGGENGRSNWHNFVHESLQQQRISQTTAYLVEAIIDLCYNYAVEDSIGNVSKHYQWFFTRDPSAEQLQTSFYSDFAERLLDYWGNYQENIHFFAEEDSNITQTFSPDTLAPWHVASTLLTHWETPEGYDSPFYAQSTQSLQEEQTRWAREIKHNHHNYITQSILMILCVCFFELLFDSFLQPFLEDSFPLLCSFFTGGDPEAFWSEAQTFFTTPVHRLELVLTRIPLTTRLFCCLLPLLLGRNIFSKIMKDAQHRYVLSVLLYGIFSVFILFPQFILSFFQTILGSLLTVFVFSVISSLLEQYLHMPDLFEQLNHSIQIQQSRRYLKKKDISPPYQRTLEENQ